MKKPACLTLSQWGALLFALFEWLALSGCMHSPSAIQARLDEARQTGHHEPVVGELAAIPVGEFLMGHDRSHESDERPAHSVRVNAFRLGRTEVTRAQFLRFVAATGYHNAAPCWGWDEHYLVSEPHWGWQDPGFPQSDDHPVACISWQDAQAYVDWLNDTLHPALPYRLPTEAEWEYAASAAQYWRYPWGEDMTKNQANCWVCSDDFEHTAPAGSFTANAWGIFDMAGNLAEWVQDCYVNHYRPGHASMALEIPECRSRVTRGGSWGDPALRMRLAYRVPYLPGYRHQALGFRLAQDAP